MKNDGLLDEEALGKEYEQVEEICAFCGKRETNKEISEECLGWPAFYIGELEINQWCCDGDCLSQHLEADETCEWTLKHDFVGDVISYVFTMPNGSKDIFRFLQEPSCANIGYLVKHRLGCTVTRIVETMDIKYTDVSSAKESTRRDAEESADSPTIMG